MRVQLSCVGTDLVGNSIQLAGGVRFVVGPSGCFPRRKAVRVSNEQHEVRSWGHAWASFGTMAFFPILSTALSGLLDVAGATVNLDVRWGYN